MSAMRDLNDDYKISVRGIEEVEQALGMLVARVKADRKIRYKTHTSQPAKPGKAAVVNALILYVDGLPPAQQKQIIAAGLAVLDRCLAMDSPGGGESRKTDDETPDATIEGGAEDPPMRKRRKGGNAG